MTRQRLFVAGVFASFAVLLLLSVVIFQFGRRNPSPPSLQDKPNPAIPGEVIYLARNSCVTRISATGANKQEIVCPGRVDYLVRLDDRAIVYGFYFPSGGPATQRDLVTGQEAVLDATMNPDKLFTPHTGANQRSVLDEFITVDPDGSVYRSNSTEPGRTRIFDCDCANYRSPQFLTWSPDGQWVMVTYWKNDNAQQQLWIIARDGSFAGTLAAAGPNANASWFIEGKGVLPKSALTPVAR